MFSGNVLEEGRGQSTPPIPAKLLCSAQSFATILEPMVADGIGIDCQLAVMLAEFRISSPA